MFTRADAFDTFRPLTRGDILRSRRVHEPVTLSTSDRPVTYEILRAHLTKVRYCRDFGRVEACVAVTYAHHPSAPPRTAYLLASVPLRRKGQPNELRQRLIGTAISLSLRFDGQPRQTAQALPLAA